MDSWIWRCLFYSHFEWAKHHDPVFGSYGHISCLVPEHLFIMCKQLNALIENDGWKPAPEFVGFLSKAFNGVNEMGEVSKVGKEYFQRLPKVCLDKFKETFHAHTPRSGGQLNHCQWLLLGILSLQKHIFVGYLIRKQLHLH
jgi:hypothetical protein